MSTTQHAILQTFIHFYITTNYLNIQSSCRISILQTNTQRRDFGTTQVIQKCSFVIMTTEEHVCMLLRKQKNRL